MLNTITSGALPSNELVVEFDGGGTPYHLVVASRINVEVALVHLVKCDLMYRKLGTAITTPTTPREIRLGVVGG